jgi:hypothetical protein
MLISRLFNICNNDSSTIKLITYLLGHFNKDNINYLFTQLEENNIKGFDLYNIWTNECNNDYNMLFTLDYSKFNNKYFINNRLFNLKL